MGKPAIWKRGDAVLLVCKDGEKWLAEIALASANGKSLAVTFQGMVAGHLNMMPLLAVRGDLYQSIIDGTQVQVRPLPRDWLTKPLEK